MMRKASGDAYRVGQPFLGDGCHNLLKMLRAFLGYGPFSGQMPTLTAKARH
jgi:hypothetical protein